MNNEIDKILNELKNKINHKEKINKNLLLNNNQLSNENKNLLFKLKEKEIEIIEKNSVIENLEKKIFNYKKQLINLIKIINQNKINISINISPSLNNHLLKKYDCQFLIDKNNNTLKFSKKEIQNKKIIDFSFNIINNGMEEWPFDTILKCNPDESNIYFFYAKYKSEEIWYYKENNQIIYVFPVRILFKNYNKIKENNILNCFLVSDREGKIGNKFGTMKLIIEK